jgi:hypothetical protein
MSTKTMMMLASGLGLSLVVGCTGSVDTDPTGAGGSGGSGGAGAGGAPGTTGSATTTSTSVTTGSGGACAGFADADGSDTVTIRFRNQSESTVYLPVGCQTINFAIDPITGPDGVTYNYDPSCLQTCEALQTSPPYACGACLPRSYRLEVGATREVTWKGTGLKPDVKMPLACWAAPQQTTLCSQILAAPTASYRITASGFSSCGAGCTCDAEGVCAGSAEGAPALASPVKFAFPTNDVVEVVFDTCAFGCPDGN